MRSQSRQLTGRSRNTEGFTLIELTVVMLIIGIMVTIMVPKYFNVADHAKINSARSELKNFQGALELFCSDTGTYPWDSNNVDSDQYTQGLAALVNNISESGKAIYTGWNGPYLSADRTYTRTVGQTNTAPAEAFQPRDPWGNPYHYQLNDPSHPSKGFELKSDGPDGTPATGDDLSWP